MLFDKIGRKFYSPDGELHAGSGTIYSGDKPYLSTEFEPIEFHMFPKFNGVRAVPYMGISLSDDNASDLHEPESAPIEGGKA